MGEPTQWQVELGDDGGLPPLPGDRDGVLRIGCGDSVTFTLPSGSLPTLVGMPSLVARDELAKEHVVQAMSDESTKDLTVQWDPVLPGPYEVFLRYFSCEDTADIPGRSKGSRPCEGPVCRIVVDPVLRINGMPMLARSVVQLTVLSRCAGPIEQWPENLAPQALLGYNMVHFTPIQPPGESGSCYALDDQHSVDPTLLENPSENHSDRLEAVKVSVKQLEEEHGMLSAMDIVLNHTAGSAPWLLEHPESAYSLSNSPHLKAPAELDERLAWYSKELQSGRLGGPNIHTHSDVNRVLDGVRQHVLQPLELHDYFKLDRAACISAFTRAPLGGLHFECADYQAFKDSALPSIGASRHGVVVSYEAARRFCHDETTLKEWLNRLQEELANEIKCIERDVLDAVRGIVTYERLELKRGPVGDGNLALVPRYFRHLELSADAQRRLGKDTEIVAHNGWVMDWPATEDFAAPTWRFVYLRRHLCVWGDCVKLRYGNGPGDAVFLWDHMTRYAVSMACIFHAIRLDNAHSTPLHVSRHILAQVRKVNPHCWIFAELFTGNFQTDLHYQRTLGINALIREAMQCDSLADISTKLTGSLWGAHPLGALSLVPTLDRILVSEPARVCPMARGASASCALLPARAMPLRPRSCPALLFDCTHDNPTPKEKRHARDALPNAAIVAASCASMGSVRGYDELLPANPSVVFERRLYQKITGVEPVELGWPCVGQPVPEGQREWDGGAPQQRLVWPHGASSSVVARGSWDGWVADVPLSKQRDGQWWANVSVPASSLPVQYKFIVDGKWTCDHTLPTAADGAGNVNNVLAAQRCLGSDSPNDGNPLQPLHVSGPDVFENSLPGILVVKQVLNMLHVRLARDGFLEVGAQILADDIVAVQRRAPDSGRRTFFVVRSALSQHYLSEQLPDDLTSLEIPGTIAQLHVAATLFVPDEQGGCDNGETITGLECYLQMHGSISDIALIWQQGGSTWLKLTRFPPGSVLVFSTDPCSETVLRAQVETLLTEEAMRYCLEGLTLSEVNYLLFSCDAEEKDRSGGVRGVYDVPGYGPLVYCGLMGVCGALDLLRRSLTDLQNCAIIENIRQGDWLLSYTAARLSDMTGLTRVRTWLEKVMALITQFPRNLVPFYCDLVISSLCAAACDAVLQTSGSFVKRHQHCGQVIRDLALATVQFWGATPSAPLHWDRALAEGWCSVPSLAAGLPHFSIGFMRSWGRDTFIALRGCLLVTERFAEARQTILVFGSVVRHGLCPNLLDAANHPRYNARDATWFFLQAVQDYVEMASEGLDFLTVPIKLKWPVATWDRGLSDLEPRTVADLIHLILAAHAKGIKFQEWNAGKSIDEHMSDEGFNIQISMDEDTGMIYGGNAWNCGTWMDKMGSSEAAGNKGVPATPRDGAAVELIGLLKSTLRWVSGLDHDVFPHEGVRTKSGADLPYQEWNARLQQSFEKVFWVGADEMSPAPVRCIYKDTDGATRTWQDFQLRPNFCIAMAVAPELFTPEYAQMALRVVAERLIGPLGMCTLDPRDAEYHGDYHNDNDSVDKTLAHGWNYHQGPEWVWPLGFFLRAWHRFGGSGGETNGIKRAMRWLLNHRAMFRRSPWLSLPELTNSRGTVCVHSCPAQAWSIATLLDAMHTIAGSHSEHATLVDGSILSW